MALALLQFAGRTAHAAPGDLDSSFGGGGKVTTAVVPDHVDFGYSVAIAPDGKIVVAGLAYSNGHPVFAVVRYDAAGVLDPDFNGNGKVTTAFGAIEDYAKSVAVQQDGKIVVAGWSNDGSHTVTAVARYAEDGSLDPDFDGDGKTTTSLGGVLDAVAVALQSDGKAVVVTHAYVDGHFRFAAIRLNDKGVLDNTFDTDGVATTAVGISLDEASSLAIQDDGKIVVAGSSYVSGHKRFALLRYDENGQLDDTFGGDGIVTMSLGSFSDEIASVAIQADGKIVAAGRTSNGGPYKFVLARFNEDGSPDSGFDVDGRLTTSLGSFSDEIASVAVQSDGKIVAAGRSYDGSYNKFVVVRYNPDGSLDTSFDGDGKVTTPFGGFEDSASSVAIQGDGKIVAAGSAMVTEGDVDFAVVRYIAGECGNGVTESGESCDDGNTSYLPGDYCRADCHAVRCGKPTGSAGNLPLASDALFVLRAAVGHSNCDLRLCDVDSSGAVVAGDALRILRNAVGQDAPMTCWDPAIGVHCGDPGTPSHAVRSGTVLTQGGVLTFACDTCYAMAGSSSRTCQANASWSGTQPVCSLVSCGNPGTPVGGNKQGTTYTCGASVSYTCSPGYTLIGDTTRSCATSGTWSGTLPDCIFGLPAAPSNLSATPGLPTKVDLAWSDNSSDETGFAIERKTGAGGLYGEITTTAAGANSYHDLGVLPFTTYFYRVRAINLAGHSAWSNEASATTSGQCKGVNISCSAGNECCSTVCSAGECCNGEGGTCASDSDCCLNSCSGGQCGCKPGGSVCINDSQCCGGVHCLGGLCGCRAIGSACNLGGECCSNRCTGGMCCRVSCQVNSDCCSNVCLGFTCQ